MKRAKRAKLTGYAYTLKERKVNDVHYHFLSTTDYKVVKENFSHYKTVKAKQGEGSSTWHEYRFVKGKPRQIQARSDYCGCANCMQTPPQQCLLTHGAGPFHNHVLQQCRNNDVDVDSSPAAEDEQRPSYYDERDNEAEGVDIDSNDIGEDVDRQVVQFANDN